LNEYKRESFNLFEEMLTTLREKVTSVLCHIQLQMTAPEGGLLPSGQQQEMYETREDPALQIGAVPTGDNSQAATLRNRQAAADRDPNDPKTWGRVSRNAICPCGSGRKFKHCHGKVS
ncbi:MAG: SEC-C metal-binding domain-containing protein, partial [Rhodospirillales bacterium]